MKIVEIDIVQHGVKQIGNRHRQAEGRCQTRLLRQQKHWPGANRQGHGLDEQKPVYGRIDHVEQSERVPHRRRVIPENVKALDRRDRRRADADQIDRLVEDTEVASGRLKQKVA